MRGKLEYKKEINRPLSPYQRSIIDAALRLCLQNLTLLKKSIIMAETRKKIISMKGFVICKGGISLQISDGYSLAATTH